MSSKRKLAAAASKHEYEEELQSADGKDRMVLQARQYLKNFHAAASSTDSHKCLRCWMVTRPVSFCFCHQIPSIPLRHQVILYTHFKELTTARGSNTGKLLLACCPERVSMCVVGIQEDEQRLVDRVSHMDPNRVLVLYPAGDALTVPMYLNRLSPLLSSVPLVPSAPFQSAVSSPKSLHPASIFWTALISFIRRASSPPIPSHDCPLLTFAHKLAALHGGPQALAVGLDICRRIEECLRPPSPPLLIILLDGTWTNAKMMNRRLEKLHPSLALTARVKLTNSSREHFTSIRKNSVLDNVSTAGAFALLLRELGEPSAVTTALESLVDTAAQAFLRQTSKPPQLPGGKRSKKAMVSSTSSLETMQTSSSS